MTVAFLRTAVVLGLLSAVGPFAIDMYLPALPSIGADLGASTTAVQMTLLAFFISSGLAPLFIGPISDMTGRKAPLYAGLALFIVGSIGSALAASVESLIAFRFIQGVGAAAGMVIPRAMVRDLHTGTEAARLMSLLMLVFSISPILAPSVGSLVIEGFGWRGVFWAVAVAAVLAIALMATALPETRPAGQRSEASFRKAFSGYGDLLKDFKFLGLCLIGGFGISSFFVYLMNSAFVMIEHYGLSPSVYSLFFSLNAVSFFSMSQLTGMLSERYGLRRVMRFGVTAYAMVMVALLAVMTAGYQPLWVLAVLLFIGYGFLGLVIPTSSVLAMDDHGENAGAASALMGTLHIVAGALAMVLSGQFFDGRPASMVAAIATCAVLAFILTQLTLGRERRLAQAAAE